MNELDIQGKKYISSKRAAEITGYAKDYVGQLARQGKVPATRVGRAWYVDEEAITLHSQGKITETLSGLGNVLKVPVQATKTSLHLLQTGSIKRNVLNTWGNINYSEGDEDLIPSLSPKDELKVEEKPAETKIQVRKADTAHIKPTGHAIEGVKVKNSEPKIIVQQEVKNENLMPLLLAPAAVAVFGVFIAGWGIFMPSAWSFDTNFSNLVATTGAINIDYLVEYFIEIFNGGISLISSFLDLLFGSLSDFFNLGLEFLLNLL